MLRLVLALVALSLTAARAESDCVALGFTGLGLCSSCDALEAATLDAELAAECRGCCVAEADGEDDGPFLSAVLEVDSWRLASLPELKAFKEELPKLFPAGNVGLHLRSYASPTLVLQGGAGQEAVRVPVGGWKKHTLVEYLGKKLEKRETK